MSVMSSTVPKAPEVRTLPRRSESFSLLQLQSGPPRKRAFTAGFFIQIVLLGLFGWMAAYAPKQEKPHLRESVVLVAPTFIEPETPKPPKMIAPKLPKLVPLPTPTPKVEEPKLEPPKIEAKLEPMKVPTPQPPVPQSKVVTNNFASVAPTPAPAPPKPEVKTDVFAGSSTTPTIKAPPQQVQTGGFGDPNGFKGQGQEAKLNVPKLGGFDRPAGPGDGNGWGGAKGKPGVVASAGFGSGVAATNPGRETPGGGVHAGGFGDAQVGPSGGGNPVAKSSAPPPLTPVEVIEKPDPQYTQEARSLKIEGEVHLKVVFQADGRVQVLQVVRGLGHGLDEAAETAARKIRFKPAERDGRRCDQEATVHIVFQLAS